MLSPRPWKLEAVLRLALGVFVCLCVGMVFSLLVWGPTAGKAAPTIGQVLVAAFSFQGAGIVLVWWFLRVHGLGWTEAFGLRNTPVRAVALGALAVCVFLPIGSVLQALSLDALERVGLKPEVQSAVEALHHVGRGPGLLAFIVVTVVVAPLGEELLFRGVLYSAVKSAGYPRLAFWGSSVLFAGIHLNLPIFLPLLLLALLLVALYEQTNNLLAPVAAHMLFNATNLVIFFLRDHPFAPLPPTQ